MPGNLIVINGSDSLRWYVGDSKMPELISTLNRLGTQVRKEKVCDEKPVSLAEEAEEDKKGEIWEVRKVQERD